MVFERGKNGDGFALSTVLVLVIALICVVVLFFFWKQINWTGLADRGACHESVVIRGGLPSLVQGGVPLRCQTDKICITGEMFGGECEDFKGQKGVTKVKVKNIDQVQKVIAGNIVDCWEMMGEGKLSLFEKTAVVNYGVPLETSATSPVLVKVGFVEPRCVICTRVAFDTKSLTDKEIDLSKMDVSKYMRTHKVAGDKLTYAQKIGYDASNLAQVSTQDFKYEVAEQDGVKTINSPLDKVMPSDIAAQATDTELQSSEMAIVFMQIAAPKHAKVFDNTLALAGVGVGTSFAVSPWKAPVAVIKTVLNPKFWVLTAIAGAYQHTSVAYNRAVSSRYCGDVTAGDTALDGCSVIRTVNYDAKGIGEYCSKIDSVTS